MAFVKKTWKDRLSEFPKRWKLKLLGTSGDTQSVELELDDGTVITQGDRFTAATMNDLEQRIADAFESSVSGVASFNGRVGAVTPSNTDYPSSMIKHTNSDTTETTVESAINGLAASKADGSQLRSAGSSGTDFYFDYKNGKYGWNSSPARGADTFHPFKQPVTLTKAISSKTTTDLGEDHTYRYIDTTGVVNTNSGTYTASSRGASLDMGASNSYRYVNTNGVPNTNSGTYTFSSGSGGTVDLGESNTYRYANAGNVYSYGFNAGKDSVPIYNVMVAAGMYGSTATASANSVSLSSTNSAAVFVNVRNYNYIRIQTGETAQASIEYVYEDGNSSGENKFNFSDITIGVSGVSFVLITVYMSNGSSATVTRS